MHLKLIGCNLKEKQMFNMLCVTSQ